MLRIDIRHNIKDAVDRLGNLSKGMADKAITRTINKTAVQGKTQATREIKEQYQISTRVVGRGISIRRAGRGVLQAVIKVEGRPLPMIAFQAKKDARGVSVVIKGRRVVVPHAFIATLKSGHKGVFARGGYKGGFEKNGQQFGRFQFGKQRFPIGELFTASLPQGFNNKVVKDKVVKRINEQFPKVLGQEIAYLLSQF
jgi:hypothetical protein